MLGDPWDIAVMALPLCHMTGCACFTRAGLRREESDAKINPNLMEMKLRAFSTKVTATDPHANDASAPVFTRSSCVCQLHACVRLSVCVCLACCRKQVHTVATTVAYKQEDATEAQQDDQTS